MAASSAPVYGHVITTDRLLLRPVSEADVEPLARLNADPEVYRYMSEGAPLSREQTWRSIAVYAGHGLIRGYSILSIEDRASGRWLGRSGPWFPEGWPHLEVGWVVDPAVQRRGIATEAARASLHYCFEVLGADWVCSLIRPGNQPSRRVAEKLGAIMERVDELMGGPVEVWAHRPNTLTHGPGDEAAWEGRRRQG